jgi:putative tryptophan/tyrosine transport system substrate-binding protein
MLGQAMRRRDFIAAAAGSAAAWPTVGHAQQPGKMRRIGVLMSFAVNDPEGLSRAAALENGLRKLGWIKGHNLRIEYRWAGNPEVLRTGAAELLGMTPDLILANSTPVMAVLREQRYTVPIVFTQVTDPIGEGLVQNLAHPGGHLTGFTSFEFSQKNRVAQGGVAAPYAGVAVLLNADNPAAGPEFGAMETTAQSLQIKLHPFRLRSASELVGAFEKMEQARLEAVETGEDPLSVDNVGAIVALATRGRMLDRTGRCCAGRRHDGLWSGHCRDVSARGLLRRSHPQGRQSWRSSDRPSLEIPVRP